MSAHTVSPGGALMRASRVFSLPPPLRAPKLARNAPKSATLQYPTYQSITTPRACIQRGDWGFKRSLPLKSTTKSGTPLVTVRTIDTYEDITEFTSAGPHTVTLRKFQELDLPLTTPVAVDAKSRTLISESERRRSVFEEDVDKTALEPDMYMAQEDMRWKFEGPYLSSMNEGQFANYVEKIVKGRGPEFRNFLRKTAAQALTTRARKNVEEQAAMAGDDAKDIVYPAPVRPEDVTEEQLTYFVRTLRGDRPTLNQHIRVFLDLPPAPTKRIEKKEQDSVFDILEKGDLDEKDLDDLDNGFPPSLSPFADTGPPKTHPSAGLSYLRTANYTPNHALFGPREFKEPIEARIVMPKNANRGGGGKPLLGVAGFIVDIPTGSGAGPFSLGGSQRAGQAARGGKDRPTIAGLLNIEPDKVGGSKAYVHPRSAHIDPQGRLKMDVDPADQIAVAVKNEKTDQLVSKKEMEDSESPIAIARQVLLGKREAPNEVRPRWTSEPNGRGSAGYGLDTGAHRQVDLQRPNTKAPKSEVDFLSGLAD